MALDLWDVTKWIFNVVDGVVNHEEYTKEEERQTKLAHEKHTKDFNEKYSLSCRKCGGLAKPIIGTTRNYKCSCGNQFTSSKHPSSPFSGVRNPSKYP